MSVQVPTLPFKINDAVNTKCTNHATVKQVEASASPALPSVAQIEMAVARAGRRIAPLWPLNNFVAVNPFLGLVDQPFAVVMEWMAHRAGATMTAPRSLYVEALQTGKINDEDLASALAQHPDLPGGPYDVESLRAYALRNDDETPCELVPTVADLAHTVTGNTWSRFINESISRWAAAYFDQGQAYWKSPWRDLSPYAAWRAEMAIDRTPELAGIPHFRRIVASLPADADEAIAAALTQLAVPLDGLDAYLHRLLLTNNGWASHARYRLWQAELRGNEDETLTHLLAIRLMWEVALLQAFGERGLNQAWESQKATLAEIGMDVAMKSRLSVELLLQSALEHVYQRTLLATLANPTEQPLVSAQVQAAFCIDVRSEVLRRAWETVDASVETIGVAGFFGFPIEYVRLGERVGSAQCPALLAPQFVIHESVHGATADKEADISQKRALARRMAKAWRSFKFGAVSCFGFVGPVGLAYIKKLITDSLGRSRPVAAPETFGLDKAVVPNLGPRLESGEAAHNVGMTLEEQISAAAGVLTAMSLIRNFARIVLLVGHGSTTVNNPYATGLDCGACGGHTGEANVRVAVKALNHPDVRMGLRQQGIAIPDETRFVAALHDTTTDQVTILDKAEISSPFAEDIGQIEANLAAAGHIARTERAHLLKLAPDTDIDAAVLFRSRDWSQVRPEWGLAGCAAFIVAPRQRTRGCDLGGRAFLHSYDWRQDPEYNVLELIMTAPMVVASWINLQYYGSTVDNDVFGSGNKVLHNVVGTLGVLEGNGGDLRMGLPWQSVHDGVRYVHEPLRLTVLIQAPLAAITNVIAQHETVRHLVDHGWLYLLAMDESGEVSHRYQGNLTWAPIPSSSHHS